MPSTKRTQPAYAEPTPLELTRRVQDVSVTELGQFRTCRRRWELSTIRNLQPKRPQLYLDFGTGIHAALEGLVDGEGPHTRLEEWQADMISELDRNEAPTEVMDELFDLVDLGHTMLDNYFTFDKTSRVQLGDVIAVEGRFVREMKHFGVPEGYGKHSAPLLHESGRLLCPIVDPDTKELIRVYSGDQVRTPFLSGRIDLLTQRATPKTGLWVVDRKTTGSQPSDRGWDFDEQCTGYCYIVWRWTGEIPRGVVADYLIRAAPKDPRILQNGKLSTAKDQLTTPDLYRAALRDHGLMRGNLILSSKHEACLNALLERGWDPFFRRIEVMRNEDELLSFERRMWEQYHEMQTGDRYPNPSRMWCPTCPVSRICLAMEDGSDYEHIIEHDYVVGKDRKA